MEPGIYDEGRRKRRTLFQRKGWCEVRAHRNGVGPPEEAVGHRKGWSHNSITRFGPCLGASVMELCQGFLVPVSRWRHEEPVTH